MRLRCRFTLPAALLLALLLWQPLAWAETLHGRVSWIHDGDTIEVAGVGTVRLLGIDAPEREASWRDNYFQRWTIDPATLRQIHGAGKAYLIETLKGQRVTLQTENEQRDRYDRLLAYVYLPDGTLLNRLLLEKGYAVVYRQFDFQFKDDFLDVEGKARTLGAGLWHSKFSGDNRKAKPGGCDATI